MSSTTQPVALLNTVGDSALLTPTVGDDGSLTYNLELQPGIYRISGQVDMTEFDYEQLYYPMTRFDNDGQRTGPWDFNLMSHNEPLVPAWWLYINGEKLGLACTPRPGTEDLETKLLALSSCFERREAGSVQLTLQPYKSAAGSTLLQLHLARAWEQEPTAFEFHQPLSMQSYARALKDNGDLANWKQTIEADAQFKQLMQKISTEMLELTESGTPVLTGGKKQLSGEATPMLAFLATQYGEESAKQQLIDIVKGQIERENWGNPHEDGYTHNCDMVCAELLEPLSFVYHWAGDILEEAGLREPLRAKLELQMKRFYTQLLIWENYWGGSLLQDHGHRSCGRFGVAAINLLGVLDDAPIWVRFVMNRMKRVIAALPNDGGMPFTSYVHLHLYMDDMLTWRDASQHVTGEDIFADKLFADVIDFVVNRFREPSMRLYTPVSRGDSKNFYAGWGYLSAIAKTHQCGKAARLAELLRERYLKDEFMPIRPVATFLAMVKHSSDVQPIALEPQPFDVRPDSGSVNFRSLERDVNVAIRCAAPPAISSYYKSFCPCDHVIDAPLEGHFNVAKHGKVLLLTAEGGYRMNSRLGSVLHVDGVGPFGDIGHTMASANTTFRGQVIEASRYDDKTGEAYVRLRLDRAYSREQALIRYYREFLFMPDGMKVRDIVVSRDMHEYSWHFQTYDDRKITEADGCYTIDEDGVQLSLEGRAVECELQSMVQPTEVVWAYSNENDGRTFQHVHFKTAEKVSSLTAEFDIRW